MSFSEVHRRLLHLEQHQEQANRPRIGSTDSVHSNQEDPLSTPKSFNYKTLRTYVRLPKKTLQEATIIYKQLKTFDLFPLLRDKYDLSTDDLLRLCQHVRVEEYEAGTIIYKKGDKTNHEAYLIIDGEVLFTARDLNYAKDKIIKKQAPPNANMGSFQPFLSQFSRNQMKHKSQFQKPSTTKVMKKLKFEEVMDDEEFHDPWANKLYHKDDFTPKSMDSMKSFIHKGRGEYFGETALIYNVDRSETVVASTHCEFVVIDDLCILKANSNKEELTDTDKANLKKFIPGIQDISSTSLVERILQFFELIRLDRGAIITKQGDKGKYIYLINEGECESFSKAPPTNELAHVFPSKKLEKHYRIKSSSEQVPIFVTTPGMFIGEELIFNHDKLYNYTTKIVTAVASAFRIEKSKFVSKFPKEILQNVRKMYKEKFEKNFKLEDDKLKLYQEDTESYLLKAYENDLGQQQDSARFEKPQNVFNWIVRPNPNILNESPKLKMPRTGRPSRSASTSRSSIPVSEILTAEQKKELKKKFDEVQNRTMQLNYMTSEKSLRDLTMVQSSLSPDTRDKNNAKEFKFFSKVYESRNEKIAKIMEMTRGMVTKKKRERTPLIKSITKQDSAVDRGCQTARDPRDCTLMEDLEYFYRKKFPFPTHDNSLVNISSSIILQPKVTLHRPSRSHSRNISDAISIQTPFSTSRLSESRSESTNDKTRHKSAYSKVRIKQMMPSFNKIKMKKPKITLDIFSSFSKTH